MSQPAIHAAAAANSLSPDELHLRPTAEGQLGVDSERAGWRYLSFRVLRVKRGDSVSLGSEADEIAAVTLSGGVSIDVGRQRYELPGRTSVWEGKPWALYVPPGSPATVHAVDPAAMIAVASAPRSGRQRPSSVPVLIRPEDVEIEVRGAGNATRQINHIITPDFPADRLELVEVYTPSGNWSSWPPHKHDVDNMPVEAVLEEVYYYQFRRPEAWGIQRLYRRDGTRDALWPVRDGELVLITDGYHPFVATHGDDAYYLNALAGDRRTMACSF
ncbi:MAG TPA: 5-deoxy-glucuronate isomerase, partial [Candidatus Dormibacteraeota bacterium]|nr:5-deoxy-glucuronate isomerase [Candidatus Dormibacteraeota bacterium]